MLLGLFGKVLEMSLLGCYVIAVVLVIRLLLNKCERKFSYALWFVVFLNLCLPISFEGPFSLIPERLVEQMVMQEQEENGGFSTVGAIAPGTNLVSSGGADNVSGDIAAGNLVANSVIENIVAENKNSAVDNGETVHWETVGNLNQEEKGDTNYDESQMPGEAAVVGITSADTQSKASSVKDESLDTSGTTLQEPQVTRPANATGNKHLLFVIAGWIWLVGLVVLLGISLCKGILLSKKLKKNRERQQSAAEGVVLAEDISAPFLWGVWRPFIYLPSNMEEEERVYIVAHESYHRKRLDHITKPIVFVIVAIHWFNPLVWLAYVLFVRDMEISCDEAVLSHTESNIKKQYASSLLKYAAKQNGFVLAPLTFGEPSLKSRIKNVLGYKKRGMVVTIAAVCVVALTACGLILRPESQNQGDNSVVQEGESQGEDATPKPLTTNAPEDVQTPDDFADSPYSIYFQDILQAKYEETDGKYQAIEERNPAVTYSYVESVQEYKEMESAYAATIDFYLADGGVAKIDWLKLSEDVTLTDLTFDMSEEMIQSGSDHNAVHAMFYSKEENQLYLIICSLREAMTWMISFSPENPTDYDIYAYEYSSWFGESYCIGNHIYLHGGSGDTPYVIDTETKEGRLCTAEHTAARMATYEMSAEYGKTHEGVLWVEWMQVIARWEDVDIFSGLLMEAMDIFPGVAEIYVASREGEVLEVMIVEIETGEVTIVEDFSELTATRPLSQSEIDWFNQEFFNQGFAEEEVTVSESIRNQFLTCFYNKPEDINLAEVFYNGVGESMTEEDWICIHGEERWKRALYDTDMNVLSESEHAEVAAISWETDVIRVSREEMDRLFEENTGLEVWDTNRRGMDQFYYNKHDDVYYLIHGDANGHYILVTGGHYNADGTVSLYYSTAPSDKWVNEADGLYIVVLQPSSRGTSSYRFVSNCEVSTSSMGTVVFLEEEQTDKDLDLSPYPDYFAEVLREVMETDNYRLESSNVENLEGHLFEQELLDAKSLIVDFAERFKEADGVRPDVWNFGFCRRVGDVDIYYGEISQGTEDVNPRAGIYTAYQEEVCLGALLIDMRTGEIYYTSSEPAETSLYSLYAVENEEYNAVFEYDGLQYRFRLDMDTTNLFLRLGAEQTKENPTGNWTITPVYASNGEFEVFLGNLRGKVNKVFDITADSAPLAEYSLEGESLYGIMGEVKDGKMTILPMEEKDREPYEMYDMHVVETAVMYSLAENVEYYLLDANFVGTCTTPEYFQEYISKTAEQVCYFKVKDGVILLIGEAYIP